MHPFISRLAQRYAQVGHCLCVGLDPDMDRLPAPFPKTVSGMLDFLRVIISITADSCIAYKPNISYFEGLGIEGLQALARLRSIIPASIPMLLDAKRGDIANTSRQQARWIFDHLGADAVTLHPYMGLDSLAPFFEYQNCYHFVLSLTSNPGASDFEKMAMQDGQPLYRFVFDRCRQWGQQYGNIGVVAGATHAELTALRERDDKMLFLVPGVGAQGGTFSDAYTRGKNKDGLVLINASRSILYPSSRNGLEQDVRDAIQMLLN